MICSGKRGVNTCAKHVPRVAPENQRPVLADTCLLYEVVAGAAMLYGSYKAGLVNFRQYKTTPLFRPYRIPY